MDTQLSCTLYNALMNQGLHILVDGLGRQGPQQVGGVLFGIDDAVIARQLRRGVMDVDVVFTREPYNPASKSCDGFRDWSFCELPDARRTESYMRKRELVRLRHPAFVEWRRFILGGLADRDFYADIDLYMAREMDRSTKEKPSDGLLEYAQASDIPVTEVYEYFKLYVDEKVNKRLMLHALTEGFSRKINACKTQDDIDIVSRDMTRTLHGRHTA